MTLNLKEKLLALLTLSTFVALVFTLAYALGQTEEKPVKRYIWCIDGKCITITPDEIKIIR